MDFKQNKNLRRKTKNEEGAVLVEFSLVFMFVMLLFFSIIEFSLYIHDSVVTGRLTREAATAAGETGASPTADYDILQAIKKAGTGDLSSIKQIIIYRPDPADPKHVPADCKAIAGQGGVAKGPPSYGACNVYTGVDLNRPETDFGCVDSVTGVLRIDYRFCPWVNAHGYLGFAKRNDEVNYDPSVGPTKGTDLIGIYIKYHHTNVLGILKSVDLTQTVTVQVEATSYGTPS